MANYVALPVLTGPYNNREIIGGHWQSRRSQSLSAMAVESARRGPGGRSCCSSWQERWRKKKRREEDEVKEEVEDQKRLHRYGGGGGELRGTTCLLLFPTATEVVTAVYSQKAQ